MMIVLPDLRVDGRRTAKAARAGRERQQSMPVPEGKAVRVTDRTSVDRHAAP